MRFRTFGENLAELRMQKHLTQVELANIVGVTKQAINNIEHGISTPNVNTAAAIAIALDTTIDFLASTEDKRLWCKICSPEEEACDLKGEQNERTN